MNFLFIFLIILVCLIVIFIVKETIMFYKNKKRADNEWNTTRTEKIYDLGSVNDLTILPIIDWYTDNDNLTGEAGVSWLIKTGDSNILMDTGLNSKNEKESPLIRNLNALNIKLQDIRHIFISHLHMDHVGGLKAQKKKTFKISADDIDLSDVTVYAPTEMNHSSAKIKLMDKPEVLMPGVASEGPISRSLFGFGYTKEQALVVNAAGKGLILIIGCGHQGLKRIYERAEVIFNEPIYGIIGGLHYPVTKSRMKMLGLPMQKFIGTGKLPWQNVTREEVKETIDYLKSKNLKILSISAHDSCDWSIGEFKKEFKDIYTDLIAGVPIKVL